MNPLCRESAARAFQKIKAGIIAGTQAFVRFNAIPPRVEKVDVRLEFLLSFPWLVERWYVLAQRIRRLGPPDVSRGYSVALFTFRSGGGNTLV